MRHENVSCCSLSALLLIKLFDLPNLALIALRWNRFYLWIFVNHDAINHNFRLSMSWVWDVCVLPDHQYGFSTWLSTPVLSFILYPHFFFHFFFVCLLLFLFSLVHSILQPDGRMWWKDPWNIVHHLNMIHTKKFRNCIQWIQCCTVNKYFIPQ
jgi:hypothetical protein